MDLYEYILLLILPQLTVEEYVVGCYFTNWAQHRQQNAQFLPRHIDPKLCTHLYFAFADIDIKLKIPTTFEKNDILPTEALSPHHSFQQSIDYQIKSMMGSGDLTTVALSHPQQKIGLYEQVNRLKHDNPQMKTLLSLGGASVNGTKFRLVFGNANNRKDFIRNTVKFLRKHKFDGLDLDWEFPENENDKKIFSELVKDYRREFQNEAFVTNRVRLLLTAAVQAYKPKIEAGYNVALIGQYLDLINLMAYDYHGAWDPQTGHNSPLFSRKEQRNNELLLNQKASIDTWLEYGVPSNKLVLGMPMYGRTFRLRNKKNTQINSAAKGAGKKGKYTLSDGFLAYYEICDLIANQKWKNEWSSDQEIPYAYKDDQWVGYDNVESIRKKSLYVAERNLAGAMVWSLDLDDFTGEFCKAGKYPLLTTIKKTLDTLQPPTTPIRIQKMTTEASSIATSDFPSSRHTLNQARLATLPDLSAVKLSSKLFSNNELRALIRSNLNLILSLPFRLLIGGDLRDISINCCVLTDVCTKTYNKMKLMFVGIQAVGKTSLLNCLRREGTGSYQRQTNKTWSSRQNGDRTISSTISNRSTKYDNLSTVGVDISDWIITRSQYGPVTFRTWDFSGQREYYATHQYFFSRRALYLACWKISDDEKGINDIHQWLINIQVRKYSYF
ncbi:unnamed protein product [Didymodactylos carnosus]|uniref:Uncharacterized protein n=1 Tax=Didymodactylos carnosus TaxID=1234261 RepID=A0A813P2C3_9BILA|nr:unnamed protein product [Didymodactylos carnosus]CAF0744363.1 unnamed protein product [Didymodactylos carnosus]CAF3499258.1 unnamed protein product [Didymodactylos carnosus]CAF3522998.1 unnamed protein product [Didymodactylos carnosus]